jgi:flagellar FliJ protein
MAKFVYSMQSVLNLKIKTENQSKMEFGVAQMHLNEELDKMESLQRRLEDYLFQGEELQKSILDVNEILFNRNAVENIKAQI